MRFVLQAEVYRYRRGTGWERSHSNFKNQTRVIARINPNRRRRMLPNEEGKDWESQFDPLIWMATIRDGNARAMLPASVSGAPDANLITRLMNQLTPFDHLARITPVADAGTDFGGGADLGGGTVLSLRWKLFLNASLMLMPVMMFGLAVPIFGAGLLVGSGGTMFFAAASLVVALSAQFAWAGTYPEWPMNRLLVRRLRKACRSRLVSRSPASGRRRDWIDSARMVEWVPRENWGATRLDTAEDVMFIRIDDQGVELEGDVSFYHFPPASIIDVEVQSIRPAGCFHSLHFVILTIRSEDGPVEFPLSYRDHSIGRLRSSHRLRQTHELAQAIRGIASGGDLTLSDPDSEVRAVVDPAHIGAPGPAGVQMNPYAAPRSV